MNEAAGGNGQATDPRVKPRRGFLRRGLRRITILVCLLFALVAGLYLTRERTLHPLLVRFLPSMSRALSPYQVSVAAIDGDWRHGLRVEGVKLVALERNQALRSLDAEVIEVKGSLIGAAWRGELDAITRVQVAAPKAIVDTRVPSSQNESSREQLIPPGLPRIELDGGELTVMTPTDILRFGDLTVAGRGDGDEPWAASFFAQANNWSGAIDGRVFGTEGEGSPGAISVQIDVPGGVARGVDIAVQSLQATWSPGQLALKGGSITAGQNRLTINGVTLSGSGSSTVAGGRMGFQFLDLAAARQAIAAFAAPQDDETKSWSGQAGGTLDLLEAPGQIAMGTIRVSGENVVIEGVELGSLEASLEVERGAVTVTELTSSASIGTLIDGSGSYMIDSRELVNVQLGVRVDRPSTLAPGLTWARGVDASILLNGPLDRPSGRFSVRADSVVAGSAQLRRFQAMGTLDEGVLFLDNGRTDTEYGTVALGGRVVLPFAGAELDVTVEQLEFTEGQAQLALQAPARLEIDGSTVRVTGLKLAGTAGEVAVDYEGGGGAPPRALVSAVDLSPGPFLRRTLTEWFGSPVDPGTLDGSFEYSSSPFRAAADLTVSVDPTRLLNRGTEAEPGGPAPPIRGRIRGSWDGATVDIKQFKVDMPGASVDLVGNGERLASSSSSSQTSPREAFDPNGPLSIDGSFLLEETWLRSPLASLVLGELASRSEESARGTVGGTLALRGTWGNPTGSLALTGEGLEWIRGAANKSPKAGESLLPRPVRLDTRVGIGDEITVESGTLELVDCVQLDVDGRIALGLDFTSIARDPSRWLEEAQDAALDLRASLHSNGLEEFSVLIRDLRETSGQIDGELRIEGSLLAPLVTGEVDIAEAGARFRGVPPVENANIGISIDQRQIRVTRGSLEIGASPVQFEGSVLLGQGNPRIDAKITGDEVLLVRTANARIRADLDLELHGRTNALVLGGDVLIKGGRVRSPIEFQSLLEGGGRAPRSVTRGFKLPAFGPPSLQLNARIRTQEPLALQGRIARGEIRTDLQLTGNAAHPAFLGSIFFDTLELAVPAGTITFPSGLVQFDRNAPEIPRIDIVGTTRLAGYDVTVSVEGDYDQPSVELSSAPSLPADDLLLLVLSGQPPSAGGGLEAAGQSVALYVAKDLVRGWFSSGGFEDEDRESFLDRLELVTGRDVSQSGVLTVEAIYKLREGLARDKDALYVVLERDAYEDYGLGLRLVLRLR